MAAPTVEPPESFHSTQDDELYQKLDAYPWDSDEEFQAGLRAILGPNPSAKQTEPLNLRARCFYYSRKHNIHVDFNGYQAWHAHQGDRAQSPIKETMPQAQAANNQSSAAPDTTTNTSNGPPAPYPTSFEHIVNLITTGQPIPGIKDIPDTVLSGQASQPTAGKRRKPWEKDPAEEFLLPSILATNPEKES